MHEMVLSQFKFLCNIRLSIKVSKYFFLNLSETSDTFITIALWIFLFISIH